MVILLDILTIFQVSDAGNINFEVSEVRERALNNGHLSLKKSL
jgi:hypothetical protein